MKKIPILACFLAACTGGEPSGDPVSEAPPDVPETLRLIVGEYSDAIDTVSVLEEGGGLTLLFWHGERLELTAVTDSTFETESAAVVAIQTGNNGRIGSVSVDGRGFDHLSLGAEDGGTFTIAPMRAPDELLGEALAATPPEEQGDFLESDLVELVTLDPTVVLDIRYASTNNFMGEVFYSEPRAFLQRPAAEALVRANRWLSERGYGLLVHDGYRPWYVTKMFWDATPEELRIFVANPANGSRHNRGCAVDLTLYDLETGTPITMTGGYDEMSPRSFPDYPGGTARQRWHRELLREAMEAQDFTVYEAEWWHFDYKDWRRYHIGNQRFEEFDAR
jgi:D-alanyl-D-alanine dipeptidase